MCKWLLLLSLSQWFICKLLTEFLNLKLTNAKPKINTTSLLLNWEIARNLTAFLMISCLETHNCSPSCFATLYRVHVDFLKSPTGFVFSLSCKCTNKQELYLIGPLRVDISIQVFRTWGVKIALPLFCLLRIYLHQSDVYVCYRLSLLSLLLPLLVLLLTNDLYLIFIYMNYHFINLF